MKCCSLVNKVEISMRVGLIWIRDQSACDCRGILWSQVRQFQASALGGDRETMIILGLVTQEGTVGWAGFGLGPSLLLSAPYLSLSVFSRFLSRNGCISLAVSRTLPTDWMATTQTSNYDDKVISMWWSVIAVLFVNLNVNLLWWSVIAVLDWTAVLFVTLNRRWSVIAVLDWTAVLFVALNRRWSAIASYILRCRGRGRWISWLQLNVCFSRCLQWSLH